MTDPLFSVEGKRVLVTGGASGVGRMISEGFAARGARVFAVSRKQESLETLARDLSSDVGILSADLSDNSQIEAVAHAVRDHFSGELDVLINNAGATWGASIDDFPEKGWDRCFDLNVKALFFLTQQCLPLLRAAAKKSDDRARVINIGSISGLTQPPDNAWAYHPAKAAVHHLTRSMAKGLANEGISVNAIAPGLFPSKMTQHLFPEGDDSGASGFIPMGRVGQPDDIVGATVFLASRASAFMTGALLTVDGGSAVQ